MACRYISRVKPPHSFKYIRGASPRQTGIRILASIRTASAFPLIVATWSARHILKRNSYEDHHLLNDFTETARKAVFLARYEAIQSSCAAIESERLLLGILRPDAPLTARKRQKCFAVPA
jgi:hypothetical protein